MENSLLLRKLLVLPLILLAACGGGGGSGDTSGGDSTSQASASRSSRSNSNSCFRTNGGDCLTNTELAAKAQQLVTAVKSEIAKDIDDTFSTSSARNAGKWPLEMVNHYRGLAHLELVRGSAAASTPGKGVTLGVIDSGIRSSHHAFSQTGAGAITVEYLAGATQEAAGDFSHGTAVTSVAAGRYYGAYGGDIKMFAIPLGSGGGTYTPITLPRLLSEDSSSASLYNHVLGKNLDILNLSFGYNGGIEGYTESQLRANYGKTIAALAQSGRSSKTILVWAAGNAWGQTNAQASSPEILPGLVARISELQGHSIAVVSVGEAGTISSFSNRCGIAKAFCIAAPGHRLLVADTSDSNAPDTTYGLRSGTSYAAPMVSGGLAIMKHVFRNQLSNEQLVSRLFATAKDDGIYANADTYGHGLMDLGAATNPWGVTAFIGSDQAVSTSSQGVPISASLLAAATPLGDSLSRALGGQEVAVFDSLGAPFWVDAGAFTVEAPGASVAAHLQEVLHPSQWQPVPHTWQAAFHEDSVAPPYGHLSLASGADRLTLSGPEGISATVVREPERLHGMTMAWTPPSVPMLSLGAGFIREHDTLLGSEAAGAFGELAATTTFLSGGLRGSAGRWSFSALGEVGQVSASVRGGSLVEEITPLGTSSFHLSATREFDNGHRLRLSVAQPLRVEDGAVEFSLPTGRTPEGVVTGRRFSAPLAPSGRQLDLTTAGISPWWR